MADNPRPPKTLTLLFAVSFPDNEFDPNDVDPEQVADELVAIINEERIRNGGYAGNVMVSAIPPAQWMTSKTISRYRRADAYLAEQDKSDGR